MIAVNGSTDAPELPLFRNLVLYTGNLMTYASSGLWNTSLKKSNQELIHALQNTMEYNLRGRPEGSDEGENDIPCFAISNDTLEIPDVSHTTEPLAAADRPECEITAKLFYLSTSGGDAPPPEFISSSTQYLTKQLGTDIIDTFIVSFDDITLDPEDDDCGRYDPKLTAKDLKALKNTEKVFETLHACQKNGTVKEVGVSDFSRGHLAYILANTEIRPRLDQINLQNCCDAPVGLIDYAKANSVDLTTNGDCAEMLSAETLGKLLAEYDLCSAQTNGHVSSNVYPRWVLKYSVFIKNRGIVLDKGYIVGAGKIA